MSSNRNPAVGNGPEKTLRRQPSRVLGKTSTQSLRSHSREEHDGAAEEEELPNGAVEECQPTPEPQLEPPVDTIADNDASPGPQHEEPPAIESLQTMANRKESMWSMWTRRTSQLHQRPQSLDTEAAVSTSAASIKSAHSQVLDTPGVKSDDASIKSKEDRKDSWIGWTKRPSSTSLKKTLDEEVLQNDDTVKSVAREEEPRVPASKDRQYSWSFWNNSTTAASPSNDPSLSNVLLSGGDAVLFEETDHPSRSAKPTQKPKIPSIVVPTFENSLPYYSMGTSAINNFNRLRYTLGFEVPDPKHLYRVSSPPKNIKKVLIIGVHGFFPTKVLRPLIGEPTGTSIKFANEAEKAVWRWANRENIPITVQKIALEREGRIFNRVEFLYEVLKKWQKDVESADYIYFAAHSQGCPVSIILLARLIEDGIITTESKKISMLLMAGINNGPFYGVDQKLFVRAYSTIESDSLMELFQFQNFESVHSREFLTSLKTVIKNNVKLTFVGSINDQLVPLYSSTCLHVRHPNIFRATYIDGSSNTPSFVSRSVSMANHLHNIGHSDHGVIKEISNSLAGPLTGGGHSTIYNDPQVYDLALSFSLYTNDLRYDIPLHFKPYVIEQLGTNPYHLPWCMRGLLFEARAHWTGAESEINKLLEEFEAWKPETKQLKDMKYRLNGIKSKL